MYVSFALWSSSHSLSLSVLLSTISIVAIEDNELSAFVFAVLKAFCCCIFFSEKLQLCFVSVDLLLWLYTSMIHIPRCVR